MDFFERYRLEKEGDFYVVILYLNSNNTEFADELGHLIDFKKSDLNNLVQNYVKEKFPDLKIKAVRVVLGSLLLATIPTAGFSAKATELGQNSNTTSISTTSFGNYTVVPGDSLWSISSKTKVPVASIKNFNAMTTDNIFPNQVIKIPSTALIKIINHRVISGDTLWKLSQQYGVAITTIKTANNIISDTLSINTVLLIPVPQQTSPVPAPAPSPSPTPVPAAPNSYTVVGGDSLWSISQRFNTTVTALKAANNLTGDAIAIGQVLVIPIITPPVPAPAPSSPPAPSNTGEIVKLPDNIPPELRGDPTTVSYRSHTVVSGDNSWNIAIKYGIPMAELLRVNNLTEKSTLSIGQVLRVPVYTIPTQPTMGTQFGEYLDWWTQAQYLLPISKTARVIDLETGRSFNIKRTIGAAHADSEPLTAADAAIMKEIWGGSYSWNVRPIIVEVDGRRLAAAMSSMPHDVQYITDNNFGGHFDIHFLNSLRHKDGLSDSAMQTAIRTAAGLR